MGRFRKLASNEFQTVGAMKLKRTVANIFETAFRDFQVFRSMIGGCVKSDTCREKLKGKREVYRRSDGRQELRSCIRSGISRAANGVNSAAVLYGLAFVFSERAELHCSDLCVLKRR